tara:strand:- start:729 stop:944 length:216 start_codon:yes stop_codon:yes gene_type:complete
MCIKYHYLYLVQGNDYVAVSQHKAIKHFKTWLKYQKEIWGKYENMRFIAKHQTEAEHNAFHQKLLSEDNHA